MGAKLSPEMEMARKLMAAGKSAAHASRVTGLTKGAISQDSVCKKIQEERRNAKKTD